MEDQTSELVRIAEQYGYIEESFESGFFTRDGIYHEHHLSIYPDNLICMWALAGDESYEYRIDMIQVSPEVLETFIVHIVEYIERNSQENEDEMAAENAE